MKTYKYKIIYEEESYSDIITAIDKYDARFLLELKYPNADEIILIEL